jgi:hypothetical protein
MINNMTVLPTPGHFSDASTVTKNRKGCLQRQGGRQGLSGRISLKINLLYSNGCIVREFDRSTTAQKPLQPFNHLSFDTTNV